MERNRLVRLFLSVLVVVLALSGCKSMTPLEAKKTSAMTGGGITKLLVRLAAQQAVKYGDDALNAQRLANQARNLNRLDDLLVHQKNAVNFANLAQQKADEAAALQQQLDDLARAQVVEDVLRANKAAEEAK